MGIGLAITLPFDGNAATAGNGTMASIGAANGGSGEGAPGLRPNGFYAAYFRAPDGNKLNAVVLG
jgi:hypothetical protein